jgi:hypothetical protein
MVDLGEENSMREITLLLLVVTAVMGQDQISDDAAEKAKLVTVMINAKVDDSAVPGAGIIFALASGQMYIATANHLVRRGLSEATDILVEFRWLPGQPIRARLLNNYDPALDLAIVVVDASEAHASRDRLSFDLQGSPSQLTLGAPVWGIGYPNGTAYDISTGQFSKLEAVQLKYRVLGLVPGGYSGGTLIDRNGLILGMIRQDQPPNTDATRVDLIVEQLKAWGYQVELRASAVAGGHESGRPPTEPNSTAGQARPNPNSIGVQADSSLCDDLHAYINAAEHDFLSLRGRRQPEGGGEAFDAKRGMQGMTDCTVWIYRDRTLNPSALCEAQETDLNTLREKIQTCLGSGWSARNRNDDIIFGGPGAVKVRLDTRSRGGLELWVDSPDKE